MSWAYRSLLRPLLFSFDSEEIHHRALAALSVISRQETLCETLAAFCAAPDLPVDLFGLRFPNPVGLAAGMDKAAAAPPAWQALGFGFSELGGVTWHPQEGNPAPRLFRVVPEEALINRMGFNNPGAEAMAHRLTMWRASGRWPNHPVGINLGKSKATPISAAAEDYARSLSELWTVGDFFVVNVSSPNTPNLRQLQDKAALDEILSALQEANQTLAIAAASARSRSRPGLGSVRAVTKPILVKVAPDLSFEALDDILELVVPRSIAGIVATNTTVTRPESADAGARRLYAEEGGLSGRPLRARSTEVIRHLYGQTRGQLVIIGVGGVFNAADAWEKILAGASLVQVYTGLVYEGPTVAKTIVAGLQTRLQEAGMRALSQAVGKAARS